MNAIILIGGRQYNVNEGEKVFVNRLDKNVGDEVVIDRVLMLKKDTETLIGRPTVKGAEVVAEVVKQTRGIKVLVFKRRAKKGYKKAIGHRQDLTELLIKKIDVK